MDLATGRRDPDDELVAHKEPERDEDHVRHVSAALAPVFVAEERAAILVAPAREGVGRDEEGGEEHQIL